jgi:hypothetical protein
MFRAGSALASFVAIVVASAVVVSVSGTPISAAAEPATFEPESMSVPPSRAEANAADGRTFTGDFSQWSDVQNAAYNGSGQGYEPSTAARSSRTPQNALLRAMSSTATSPEGSNAPRWLLAKAPGPPRGRRSDNQFSTKFDPSFPQNHRDVGWA